MGLEGKPEVVLVLSEHIDKLRVVRTERFCDLIEGTLHLANVVFKIGHHRVVDDTLRFKLRLHIFCERFKNYENRTESICVSEREF